MKYGMSWVLGCAVATAVAVVGCGGGSSNGVDLSGLVGASTGSGGTPGTGGAAQPKLLTCDDSIKSSYKPDADTTVLLVKAFKKGDPLVLTEPVTAQTAVAANDLCLM
jgi:feruloyl esterase